MREGDLGWEKGGYSRLKGVGVGARLSEKAIELPGLTTRLAHNLYFLLIHFIPLCPFLPKGVSGSAGKAREKETEAKPKKEKGGEKK